jgi:hypothetical protein
MLRIRHSNVNAGARMYYMFSSAVAVARNVGNMSAQEGWKHSLLGL